MNTEVIISVVLVIVILAVVAYFVYKKKDKYEHLGGLVPIPPKDVKKFMSKFEPKSKHHDMKKDKKEGKRPPYRGQEAPPPYLYRVNN